jgi:hypothetical protein
MGMALLIFSDKPTFAEVLNLKQLSWLVNVEQVFAL